MFESFKLYCVSPIYVPHCISFR